jgi:flagellar basal-body rod protein FlgC
MNPVNAIDVSASGLVAQRIRLNTIANNLANISTTEDAAGRASPYVRQRVVFRPGMPDGSSSAGVHVAAVENDDPRNPLNFGAEPFRLKYEPGHPNANEQGYVLYPNVDVTREYVNALEAARAYEANILAVETYKAMANQITRLYEP